MLLGITTESIGHMSSNIGGFKIALDGAFRKHLTEVVQIVLSKLVCK